LSANPPALENYVEVGAEFADGEGKGNGEEY
jgi:hypothetical protein